RRHRQSTARSSARPSQITTDPRRGNRDGFSIVAVFIPTDQGTCARSGSSAYPHYCSLPSWVDSAEADKVGSPRIRFCAYVSHSIDEGVRHYRTTPDALIFFIL